MKTISERDSLVSYDSISSKTVTEHNDCESLEVATPKKISPFVQAIKSIPAILLLSMYNIMLSVPFGAMFFSEKIPISSADKERIGMKMSLLALAVGQAVIGGWLGCFDTISVWAMAEVAPFFHTFADIAARNAGDPSEIYSTTVYLISLMTLMIGIVFLLCGKFGIGKLLSFFPNYITLGLIGGIGVWAATLSVDVSLSEFAQPDGPWWRSAFTIHFALTVVLAIVIRVLRWILPKEKTLILDPLFFLAIPILFYIIIAIFGIQFEDVIQAGYVFKQPMNGDSSITEQESSAFEEATEIWTNFDISKVNWKVTFEASPSLLAGSILALVLTTPFIPPIATILEEDDFRLDKEFIALGVANIIAGFFSPGAIASVDCYSSTALYRNSGGGGYAANAILTVVTLVLFVYGHVLAGYLPRCTAGSLLLDMGISLFLEGVASNDESNFSVVEYTSIWVIIAVMNGCNMTAGLIAALFMALLSSTLSSAGQDPVRRRCNAFAYPSSKKRTDADESILHGSLTGRSQIGIFQLQGTIFYGNVAKIEHEVIEFLSKQKQSGCETKILIFDFILVREIDSSSCMFFNKIQTKLQKSHEIQSVNFVVNRSGAKPLESSVSKKSVLELRSSVLLKSFDTNSRRTSVVSHDSVTPSTAFSGESGNASRKSERRRSTNSFRYQHHLTDDVHISGICFNSLDEALAHAEEKILSSARPYSAPLQSQLSQSVKFALELEDIDEGPEFEEQKAIKMLEHYCRAKDSESITQIVESMKREVVAKGEFLWNLGNRGVSAMLLFSGSVSVFLYDEEDKSSHVVLNEPGLFMGLRSMVLSEKHLTSARCEEDCVFYVLDNEAYKLLVEKSHRAVRMLELSLARHISHRLNHVSNRIYEAQSLPESAEYEL